MVITALIAGIAATLLIFVGGRFLGPGGIVGQIRLIRSRLRTSAGVSTGPADLASIRYDPKISDVGSLASLLGRMAPMLSLAEMLRTLKLNISVSVFLAVSLLLFFSVYLILSRVVPFVFAVGIALGCLFIPLGYVRFAYAKYIKQFSDGLPDMLSVFAGAFKAGHGIQSALQQVVKSAPYPVNEQFRKVYAEIGLGASLQNALANLYDRLKIFELKFIINGISINDQLGGNISETLGNIEKTLRERAALDREIRAITAEGRASIGIISFAPVFMGVVYYFNDPHNTTAFFSSPAGHVAIVVCIVIEAVAIFLAKKILALRD